MSLLIIVDILTKSTEKKYKNTSRNRKENRTDTSSTILSQKWFIKIPEKSKMVKQI